VSVQTATPASNLLWSLEEALETAGRTAAGRRDPFRLFYPALEAWLACLDDGPGFELRELEGGYHRALDELAVTPESLEGHLSAEELRAALAADELAPASALRIAHHLAAGACKRCLRTLGQAGPPPAPLTPSADPLVRALRLLTGRDSDRLTAVERFLGARIGKPLAFCRLVLDGAAPWVQLRAPGAAGGVVRAALRVVPVTALRLGRERRRDLVGLLAVYLAEAWRLEGELPRAYGVIAEGLDRLGEGTGDPELLATLLVAGARVELAAGREERAFGQLEAAVDRLAGAGLGERRAAVLSEAGFYLGRAGQPWRSREALRRADAELRELGAAASPPLRWTVMQQLAAVEAALAAGPAKP
jgi:hypothetical protein